VGRELRVFKYWLFIAMAACVIASLLFFVPGGNIRTGPKKLFDKGISLPISAFEASNDVIAKIEFKNSQVNQIDEIVEWYKKRRFNIVTDNSETNGFGPNGISFVIRSTNQATVLVIKEWKDF
jgi:hypothetical protein